MKNSSFAQINKNQIRGVIVNYADGTLLQGTSLRLTLIGGNAGSRGIVGGKKIISFFCSRTSTIY